MDLVMAHEPKFVVLPPELFRSIVEHLDRKALCAISLACRVLQDEGQRQLYRKMTFSKSYVTHTKFLTSILNNNRLALLVQEYTQHSLAVYQESTLWSYSLRGLQAMVNLKVLNFRAFDGVPSAEILADCTFQLRSLTWSNTQDEDHLSNFLHSQHNLQMLAVDWTNSEAKRSLITPSCCPRLSVLHGNRGTMETFLPGRKITSLAWLSAEPSRSHSVANLSSHLSGIRFFALRKLFTKPPMTSMFECFPFVEVFDLNLDSYDCHRVMQSLPQLKELRTLVISTISAAWAGIVIRADKRLQVFSSMFESCEKLEQIHFPVNNEEYQTYRWIAGSLDLQNTLTSSEEVHRWWHI